MKQLRMIAIQQIDYPRLVRSLFEVKEVLFDNVNCQKVWVLEQTRLLDPGHLGDRPLGPCAVRQHYKSVVNIVGDCVDDLAYAQLAYQVALYVLYPEGTYKCVDVLPGLAYV